MKTKKTKRIVAAVLTVVILAGAGTGAFFLLKKGGKTVKVIPLSEIAQTDMWMENAEYEGSVRAENLQSVYLSETQQLKEVFVHEGDTVKKGDKLASFDTTLSDLELERQKIEVQKLELNLSNKQKELRRINSMTPYVPPTPQPEPEPEVLDPVTLPRKLSGKGTEDKPYIYLWNDACRYDDAFISQILPLKEIELTTQEPATEEPMTEEPETDETEGEAPAAPVYEETAVTVIFQVREYDNPRGALVYTWGMEFQRNADGGYSFTVFEPDESFSDEAPEITVPEIDPDEGGYTAAEIAQMRAETQREIKETETQLKVERLKLKKLELEIDTGVVTAALDGVVKSVSDEETARQEGSPVVTVSAGGAWYISAYVGELDLEELSVGDAAQIRSWMGDGGQYEGTVTEIGAYPASNGWYGGSGNPNVSYYPVTVRADASATLQEGDYVSVSFGGGGESTGLYLEKPFIREENGRSFVYAMGDDGRLEKRYIGTGKIYWGSTVEITGGLTIEDAIAFPYGKNVKEGAKTELSDMSALYGDYYY
ncbi:MAG: biotin/lipoyl-binding protein [Clostridia bacterium]|nr:biotin/lipoyl-binding protein [Clostridia bacterium]